MLGFMLILPFALLALIVAIAVVGGILSATYQAMFGAKSMYPRPSTSLLEDFVIRVDQIKDELARKREEPKW